MISLIHPSRGRAEKSFVNSSEWIDKSGCDVELIVMVDNDDTERHKYEKFYGAMCYNADNRSVVEATNKASMVAKGDVLIYLSDDFKCFDNWGLAVLKEFEGESRPLLVKVDDCLQKFDVPVLTIPIMNRSLYDVLGYFWHPEYKSMFVDEDLYWTSRKMAALKFAPHLRFEHQHVSVGKSQDDETYRNSARNWDHGKAVFSKRKALGFPV